MPVRFSLLVTFVHFVIVRCILQVAQISRFWRNLLRWHLLVDYVYSSDYGYSLLLFPVSYFCMSIEFFVRNSLSFFLMDLDLAVISFISAYDHSHLFVLCLPFIHLHFFTTLYRRIYSLIRNNYAPAGK